METMPSLLAEVVHGLRSKHYPRGQIMLFQDDPPHDILVLKNGVIKIHDLDEQGTEKILHLVKPYAVVPFAFFSGNNKTIRWYYTALTDCEVCVVPVDGLKRQLEASSQLAVYMMNWFSVEVHELLVRLSSLGKTNTQDKIVAALKFLAGNHAEARHSGWLRVSFPVNHQLLANMTGVTRESAATTMKELTVSGAVRNPRQAILELNLDKLLAISGPANASSLTV